MPADGCERRDRHTEVLVQDPEVRSKRSGRGEAQALAPLLFAADVCRHQAWARARLFGDHPDPATARALQAGQLRGAPSVEIECVVVVNDDDQMAVICSPLEEGLVGEHLNVEVAVAALIIAYAGAANDRSRGRVEAIAVRLDEDEVVACERALSEPSCRFVVVWKQLDDAGVDGITHPKCSTCHDVRQDLRLAEEWPDQDLLARLGESANDMASGEHEVALVAQHDHTTALESEIRLPK